MTQCKIGVFGGSGLYQIDDLVVEQTLAISTPFGEPSDEFIIGSLNGVNIAFLPRHGRGHRILPSEINYRANVWAMKSLGVEFIIASGACGSFKEELAPGHIVIIDQFLDRTRHRHDTFMGEGIVGHVMFGDPICPDLAGVLHDAAQKVDATVHKGGTYVCMEGPAFSTRAESKVYRSWDMSVIGMTNLSEARLCREAEICYASMALVTDYDSWREAEHDVTVEMILAVMQKNVDTFRKIIKQAVKALPEKRTCECTTAMQYALLTDPASIPEKVKLDLEIILGKYLGTGQ